MDIQQFFEAWPQAQDFFINTATALLIFIIGWIASKWANSLAASVLRRRKVDEALSRFLAAIAQYAVLAAAVIASLDQAGVPSTSFVAVLGSAGLAIGLALQGSLGNFASGVMILLFRPFTLEDVITIAGHTGRVEDIGLFATKLVTPANETIIVPNAQVTGSSIINLTTRGHRRAKIEVGVAYGADVNQVMEVLKSAASQCDLVLADPEPGVVFTGLGASSLDFAVMVSANNSDFFPMQHQVRQAVYNALNAANIEIPFNQIVVHQVEPTSPS